MLTHLEIGGASEMPKKEMENCKNSASVLFECEGFLEKGVEMTSPYGSSSHPSSLSSGGTHWKLLYFSH